MPELQVKKVVAVCFLEAAKLTLEHLGAFRLELSQKGLPGPSELPRAYGDIRRLRDYLQRCTSAYEDVVDFDFADVDAALLVACCRRGVEELDNRLDMGAGSQNEREWMTKKRKVLGDWAVELARKPLVDLPLPHLAPVKSEHVRALDVRLQNKAYGDVNERAKIRPPSSSGSSIAAGITSFGDAMHDMSLEDTGQFAVPGARGDASIYLDQAAAGSSPAPARPAPTADDVDDRPPQVAALLDRRKLRDPRLRSLVGVDTTAYERAMLACDYRLATVLMASVVEAAVLDHAIPRRSELGLSGTPDTWNPQDLLLRAMGDAAQPKDRALAFHLFASRNLLRPSLQMVTPAVVTAASFERLHEFAGRALHALGFGRPAKTLPPGAIRAEDLPRG